MYVEVSERVYSDTDNSTQHVQACLRVLPNTHEFMTMYTLIDTFYAFYALVVYFL
jgi:hypothetical protein